MHSYFIHDSSYKNKTSETAIKLKVKKKNETNQNTFQRLSHWK